MKFNKFCIISIFLFAYSYTWGQSEIKFIKEIHDFGLIIEGELVNTVFEFENNGDDTLQLTEVKPSCGCTSPNWPRRPFLEGESGEIAITYNSARRPGAFHKRVTITSNSAESKKAIYIQGVVVNSKDLPSDSLQKIFSGKKEALDIKKEKIFLGKTEINKSLVTEVYIENTSDRAVTIKQFSAGCKCARLDNKPTIAAGETVKLEFNYAPRSLGKIEDKIIIITDDPAHPVYELLVHTTVVKSLTVSKGLMLNQKNTGFGF